MRLSGLKNLMLEFNARAKNCMKKSNEGHFNSEIRFYIIAQAIPWREILNL